MKQYNIYYNIYKNSMTIYVCISFTVKLFYSKYKNTVDLQSTLQMNSMGQKCNLTKFSAIVFSKYVVDVVVFVVVAAVVGLIEAIWFFNVLDSVTRE